ncbi:MAG: glycosyltransferase family 2 protein [Candidatus Pacearchaeota archaeon]
MPILPHLPSVPSWIIYFIIFIGFFTSFFYLLVLFRKQKSLDIYNDFILDVTFLIPAKNMEKTLQECVKRVVNQDYEGKINIIIINDASTDNTPKIAKELIRKYSSKKRKIILLNRKKSTGIKASVLNFGLDYIFSKNKVTPLIAHLDADTFIPKNLLKKCVPYFIDKKTMAVTSWMMPHNTKKFLSKMQKIEYLLTSFYRLLLGKIESVAIAPAFTIIRAEFFKKAGYYDENTLTEDFEIALRIKSYGYNIVYLDEKITTIVPENFNKLRRERLRWWHGTFQNLVKYNHLISPKYGFLGTFFLPINVILGILILFIAFFILIYNFIYNSFNFLNDILLGITPRFEWKINTFQLSLMLSDVKIILAFFAFILSFLFFNFAKNKMKEKINIIDYLIFIFIYIWILIIFFVEGVIKYIFKFKTTW